MLVSPSQIPSTSTRTRRARDHGRRNVVLTLVFSLFTVIATLSLAAVPTSVDLTAAQVFEPGAILISLNPEQAGQIPGKSVYDGYGMMFRLVDDGLRVNWYIRGDKLYGAPDLSGIVVDPDPDRDADFTDGSPLPQEFGGSVFLIRDPNLATDFNEAWLFIASIEARFAFPDVKFAELRQTLIVPRSDVHSINYVPLVAFGDGAANDELELIQYPAMSLTPAPGTATDTSSIAGGALFDGPGCAADRLFDIFIQSHHVWQENASWRTDTDAQSLAQQELARFQAAGGLGIYQCVSSSIEQNVHWITEPDSTVVEGTSTSNVYEFVPSLSHHPFLQTLGSIPIQAGSFQTWDATANVFLPTAQHILTDPITSDYGYMFGTVGAGTAYFMGGHRRTTLSDRRLLYNAILFYAIVPGPKVSKQLTELEPTFLVAGTENRVTVTKRLTGGSLAQNVVLVDTLDPSVSLDEATVDVRVPGGSYTWNPATHVLTLTIGDIHPDDLFDGIVATYQVTLIPPSVGTVRILQHSSLFIDYWRGEYNASSEACLDARVLPAQSDLECSISPKAIYQDVSGTARQVFTLSVTNLVSTNRFIRNVDTVRVGIPLPFGVPPTSVSGPNFPTATWTNAWDNMARELTFRNPDVDFDWTTGLRLDFLFELGVPVSPGLTHFPCRATVEGGSQVFDGTPTVLVLAAPIVGLLRNDEMTPTSPRTALATIFSQDTGDLNSLDRDGPDGWAQPGEGVLQSYNGSSDDDDFYVLNFLNGSIDPDPIDVITDATRPLVFYQMTGEGNTLRLIRSGGVPGTVALFF